MPNPIINALDVGFNPIGVSFDNTPIFNQVLKTDVTNLYFPAGNYYFNTQPDIISKPFVIRGNGINSTTLTRNFSTTNLYSALLHSKCSFIAEDFGIIAAAGTSGGSGIKAEGLSASASVFRNLYITGGYSGTFAVPLSLYSTDEMGIRDCQIDNVRLFSGTSHLAWLVNTKGLRCDINAYPAGGTVDDITIQGIGTIRPTNILMTTHYLQTLNLYNTDNLTVIGIGNTKVNQTNCNNIKLI